MDLQAGTEFAGYRIIREIGRGGMAVVYEAEQTRLHRSVALKVLPAFHAASAEAVTRFHREAEAGARLQHPNIVQVHERGRVGETEFIATEYVRGGSLAKAIVDAQERRAAFAARQGPSENEGRRRMQATTEATDRAYIEWAVKIAIEVLRGLQHAHAHGVIHRDIKPQNLLLSETGRVLIADFGLARLLEEPAFSQAGQPRGTPWYMSPEQVAVGMVTVDGRTDVFSTGVTLYELLTLERPFPGEDITTVFRRILHKEPARPRILNPRVSRDLETVVLKSLEKDPDRRYASAEAFADDLQRFLDREDILARPVGVIGHLLRRASRNKPLTFVSVALALALLGGGIVLLRAQVEQRSNIAAMLERTRAFREAGAYDRAAAVLHDLLLHVAPSHREAEAELAALADLRRHRAAELKELAERLVLEQRHERARVVLEEARRMDPDDPGLDLLYRQAAGIGTVTVTVEGGAARLYAAEYIQAKRLFAPAEYLGSTDAYGRCAITLVTGDYLVTAIAADGRFTETWLSIDPLQRLDRAWMILHATEEVVARMALVPAGVYPIGVDASVDTGSAPRADVPLDAYYIDRTEATQEDFDRYLAFLRRTGQPLPYLPVAWKTGAFEPEAAGLPMHFSSWLEAGQFLAFLGKRLPTETEWEAAARGPEGRKYPWGDEWDDSKANVRTGTLLPTGTHGGPGYAHGLYDMVGNIAEWTADRYLPYPGTTFEWDARPKFEFPIFDFNQRVLRGGSYGARSGVRDPATHHFEASYFRMPGRMNQRLGARGARSSRPQVIHRE